MNDIDVTLEDCLDRWNVSKTQDNIESIIRCLDNNQTYRDDFGQYFTHDIIQIVGKNLRILRYKPGQIVHLSGDEKVGVMIMLKGKVHSYINQSDIDSMKSHMNLSHFLKMTKQDLRVSTNTMMLEQYGIESIKKKFVASKDKKLHQLSITNREGIVEIVKNIFHTNRDDIVSFRHEDVNDVKIRSQSIVDYIDHIKVDKRSSNNNNIDIDSSRIVTYNDISPINSIKYAVRTLNNIG